MLVELIGAEHGLRLTVNIEQYEHTRGFGQNAGIKVIDLTRLMQNVSIK